MNPRRLLSDRLPVASARFFSAALLASSLLLGACRDAKVTVYQIPKEKEPAPAAPSAPANMAGTPVRTAAGGELEWVTPATWQAKAASSMRKATYAVGADGSGTELAITAFPGNVGGDLANVNRWRGQLQLPPISETELPAALTAIDAGGLKVLAVDLLGGTKENPVRMLGAMVPYDGATWFFKLIGPDTAVAREKSAYLNFLRTLKPSTAKPSETNVAAAPVAPAKTPAPAPDNMTGPIVKTTSGNGLHWTAPSHWQTRPASSMRKATFGVTSPDGSGAAELAITAFPGDVGGELANVNRWCGQLQLPPIAESDLAVSVTHQIVNGLPVTLVDVTGGTKEQPLRLLGAMMPYEGSTWFFKFVGTPAVIANEQVAFLDFVQSVHAHAP